MVIHEAIDGFSRLVTYMRCSTNNRASTVYALFLSAAALYGVPLRVRSDVNLNKEALQELQQDDPLQWSPNYGIDVYL